MISAIIIFLLGLLAVLGSALVGLIGWIVLKLLKNEMNLKINIQVDKTGKNATKPS